METELETWQNITSNRCTNVRQNQLFEESNGSVSCADHEKRLLLYNSLTSYSIEDGKLSFESVLIEEVLERMRSEFAPGISTLVTSQGYRVLSVYDGASSVFRDMKMARSIWICSNCSPNGDCGFLSVLVPKVDVRDVVFEDLKAAEEHLSKRRCCGARCKTYEPTNQTKNTTALVLKDALVPFTYVAYHWLKRTEENAKEDKYSHFVATLEALLLHYHRFVRVLDERRATREGQKEAKTNR